MRIPNVLLCSFASHRSSPAKIQRWIAYLEALGERYRDEPEATEVIEHVLARARSWQTEVYTGVSAGGATR
jgi:hypothetical protein